MKPMLNKVMDYLRKHNKKHVYSKGYKLVGIGESTLEEDMHKFYNMNPYVTVAPYASVGEIKYVFSSSNQDDLNDVSNAFLNSYKAYIYGSLEDTLEGVVVSLLASKKLKISVAESCTGGLLASRIVNVSGASSIFEEGYVTYSNSAKQNTLHVTKQTINDHGAVSEQCALEMIGGLVRKTQCDVGVSITGIAGPNGGTEDKPVGLVYFGFYLNGHFFIKKKIFNGTRDIVRYRSTQYALTIIWKELIR
jgi:nicotinamide-nucleotide amidase